MCETGKNLATDCVKKKAIRTKESKATKMLSLRSSCPRRRFERSKSTPKLQSSNTSMAKPGRRPSLEKSKSESNLQKRINKSDFERKPLSRSNSASRLATAVGCSLLTLGDVNAFVTTKTNASFVATQTKTFKSTNANPCLKTSANGFSTPKIARNPGKFSTYKTNISSGSTDLRALNNLDMDSTNVGTSALDIGTSMLTAATSIFKPAEECMIDGDHLCQDVSMLAETLPSFLKQSDLVVRTGLCASQILNLITDFMPGHHVSMDSMAYHIITLGITSQALFKTVHPMIQGHLNAKKKKNISIRDRRTFRDLFEPAGVSWAKFNAMSASAMEWIEVEPGQIVQSNDNEDDDCLYYLYKGGVEVYNTDGDNQQPLYSIEKKKHYEIEGGAGKGLIGEETIIGSIYNDLPSQLDSSIMIKAGELGAKILRIKTSELNSMLHQDNDLSQSMGLLVIQAMQAKLNMKGTVTS